MAHISCHSSDIVPNTFPPPRPSMKDHGMISAYQKDLVMHQTFPHSRQVMESGDEFPVLNFKPTPVLTEKNTIESFLDPELCITPEKPRKPARNNFNPSKYMQDCDVTDEEEDGAEDLDTLRSSKTTQKVRFDQRVDVRHLSPESLGGCDIIEIDRRGDPCLELSLIDQSLPVSCENISRTSDSLSVESYSQDTTSSSSSSDGIINHDEELSKQTKRKSQSLSTCKTVSVLPEKTTNAKASKTHSRDTRIKCGAHGDMNEFSEGGTVLTKPQFHSTLQVSREIQQLQKQDMNLAASVEQKLKVSSATESKITEKACSKVNQAGHQFPSLVSLDVHEEELLQAAAPAKVKPNTKSKLQRPEDSLSHEPDILEFFTPNLQKESASFNIQGLPNPSLGFQSSDLSQAFDVYRHIRAWEGWS